jgi:hypothetical protein
MTSLTTRHGILEGRRALDARGRALDALGCALNALGRTLLPLVPYPKRPRAFFVSF